MDLIRLTAAELSVKLAAKEVSSVEVTKAEALGLRIIDAAQFALLVVQGPAALAEAGELATPEPDPQPPVELASPPIT